MLVVKLVSALLKMPKNVVQCHVCPLSCFQTLMRSEMCKATAQTNCGPWLAELFDIESSNAKFRSVCHAYVRFVKLLPRMYNNYPDPTKLYFCCVKKKKTFSKVKSYSV